MDIFLKTNGFFISKKLDRFYIELKKESGEVIKTEVPSNKVERIILSNNGTITTSAINLAIDNNIPIIFLKWEEPTGMVWHCKIGKTAKIRRNQLKISESIEGIIYGTNWIILKMKNQINYLKDLKKNHKNKGDFDNLINNIELNKNNIINYVNSLNENNKNNIINYETNQREIKDNIIGYEGISSKYYFNGINYILPKNYKFSERSRRPAKDKFNALLNYGYGMLYPIVEKSIIVAGLDPYIGFIHSDNYNKTTLVYDIIEIYRVYIDRGVVKYINSKKVKESYFDKLDNGVSLSNDGKGDFATYIKENVFEKEMIFKNKKYNLVNYIQKQCYSIAKTIKDDLL